MIEKLKAVGEAAKNAVLFILFPLGVFFYLIYYLMSSRDEAKEQLAREKAVAAMKPTAEKAEEVEHEASKQEKSLDVSFDQLERDYAKYRERAGVPSDAVGVHGSGAGVPKRGEDKGQGSGA